MNLRYLSRFLELHYNYIEKNRNKDKFKEYDEYYSLKEEVEDFCKNNNCFLDNVNYDRLFPEEIEW